jgi:hypothetical protein
VLGFEPDSFAGCARGGLSWLDSVGLVRGVGEDFGFLLSSAFSDFFDFVGGAFGFGESSFFVSVFFLGLDLVLLGFGFGVADGFGVIFGVGLGLGFDGGVGLGVAIGSSDLLAIGGGVGTGVCAGGGVAGGGILGGSSGSSCGISFGSSVAGGDTIPLFGCEEFSIGAALPPKEPGFIQTTVSTFFFSGQSPNRSNPPMSTSWAIAIVTKVFLKPPSSS